jgi:hypothetical protein
VPSPGEGDVRPPQLLEETDVPGVVAAGEAVQDDIPLAALESVDRTDVQAGVRVASGQGVDPCPDVGHLRLVRQDDRPVGLQPVIESGQLGEHGRLGRIGVTRQVPVVDAAALLPPLRHRQAGGVDHCHRAAEQRVAVLTLHGGAQSAAVERRGDEVGDRGGHPPLPGQQHFVAVGEPVPQQLEDALGQ